MYALQRKYISLCLVLGIGVVGLTQACRSPEAAQVATQLPLSALTLSLAAPITKGEQAIALTPSAYLPLIQSGETAGQATPQPTPIPAPTTAAEPLLRAATIETVPVPNSGDAADDPAIWLHPQNRELSTIIGTDKKGGLAVYQLDGSQLQYLPDGKMNNVDLRYDFPLGGQRVALVTASNRSTNSIAIYQVNTATRHLENVAARVIKLGLSEAYGACMYHSLATDTYYFIVNDPDGKVEQWQLFDNGSGQVDATMVRTFAVGSQTEGCVADDALGQLYIGEETKGIWKYGAEPQSGATRTLVDATGATGHLTADVEGLALYQTTNGAGYLIASSQGSDAFVVYQRGGDNAYVTTFTILAGNGIDAVSGTDGIEVTSAALGPNFAQGIFVTQDGTNDAGNQNYKLVPWPAIATTVNPVLSIEPQR